ncbi:MAG: hypothetical protein AAGG02_12225 [Cyanobacteria bacterium P01_H01_bin.15]
MTIKTATKTIAIARSQIMNGAIWRHAQCVPGSYYDCAQFLYWLGTEAGFKLEPLPRYEKTNNYHAIIEYLNHHFQQLFRRPVGGFDPEWLRSQLKPGDILVMGYGHVGIVGDGGEDISFIHCCSDQGKLIEGSIDSDRLKAVYAVYAPSYADSSPAIERSTQN